MVFNSGWSQILFRRVQNSQQDVLSAMEAWWGHSTGTPLTYLCVTEVHRTLRSEYGSINTRSYCLYSTFRLHFPR